MLPIAITIKFSKPPEASIREWRKCLREAHAAQGRVWHTEMLPDHFTPHARFKYGHQKRQGRYQEDKRRAAGAYAPSGRFYRFGRYRNFPVEAPGTIDNVFTGRMRDMLVKQNPQIRGFPSRARLTYVAPEYLVMRPKKSNQPHKWQELTRTTDDQRRRLTDVLRTEVFKRFDTAQEEPVVVRIVA